MKLSTDSVFGMISLVFNGIIFWSSTILVLILLSCASYSITWLVCFVSAGIIAVPTAYTLGEYSIRKVTGIDWIEKKFHIDLTEE